ncbi:nucleoside triphosphate pyrophosphatase [Pseudorhodobacter sp.]|uniref:Maf family protein n=1 Tax=Pseudorhodobacter sp. TaxID=1934400 RepID=UPI002649EB65|nr:Maf family protein [Pseudorhodobacter sp.]MDN5788745.1 Maf family protein [Pseudorhodobacter sp.]
MTPPPKLLLASSSAVRLRLLTAAGVTVKAIPARVDEKSIRDSLEQEGAKPREIADALAEMKARKIAEKHPASVVIGCDQVLAFQGQAWGKPESTSDAFDQLTMLRNETHRLISAVVLYHEAKPIWRHLDTASLTMRAFSDPWLRCYIDRNWEAIRYSSGGYLLEEEGVRLFSSIEGDYFTILGLPLLPLLGYLGTRGFIET